MHNLTFIFHYNNSTTLKTTTKTFKEAVQFALNIPVTATPSPLKMVVKTTGKVLYFDEHLFKSFIDGTLTQIQLIEQTECDGLYRNSIDAEADNFQIIDKDSLWKLKGNQLILVDDDQSITTKFFPDSNFVEV